jgi:hypothetical protein
VLLLAPFQTKLRLRRGLVNLGLKLVSVAAAVEVLLVLVADVVVVLTVFVW